MDVCAELTLRLARAAQEALNPRSSLVDWVVLPTYRRCTWSEAANVLAAASKPALVAPLVEPGAIAVWSLDELPVADRSRVERELANQREYFGEKLQELSLGNEDFVETPDGAFRVAVVDFRRWATEYSIAAGIGVSRSPDPRTGRILIRPPGGGGPPVGWVEVS